MGVNVFPPSVLTCHCTVVGVGLPSLAAAMKVAVPPALTVWLVGLLVTVGAKSTVRVAALVVALRPAALLKTAWYSSPFCAAVAVKLRVALVAPEMSLKELPPSVLTCHCTVVGVGLPSLAAAVKLAVWPAVTIWLAGWVVTEGAKSTVRVAALVVALRPAVLLKTAWYSSPFWAAVAVKPRVALVAP